MDWKQLFKENVLNGGKDYVQNHSVHNLTSDGGTLSADVEGLESFRVRIRLGSDTVESMECGCSYAQTGSTKKLNKKKKRKKSSLTIAQATIPKI